MQQFFLIGIGGFAGAVSRFLVSRFFQQQLSSVWLPIGTFSVNMIGCYLIGLLNGLDHSRQLFSPEWRLIIFIGFLGAFTTFSTFGYETFELIQHDRLTNGLINAGGQIICGLFLVWLGNFTARLTA